MKYTTKEWLSKQTEKKIEVQIIKAEKDISE